MAVDAAASSERPRDPDVHAIRLVGELDVAAVPALVSQLNEAADAPERTVLVDLAGVTFMDCAALRPLLDARERLDSRLRLQNASRPVRVLLRHLDLTRLLEPAPDDKSP
jgi:anti-sigma B factor antagonist